MYCISFWIWRVGRRPINAEDEWLILIYSNLLQLKKKKKRKEKMVINKWENESNRRVGETEVLKKF